MFRCIKANVSAKRNKPNDGISKNEVRVLKNATDNKISAKRAATLAVLSTLGLVSFVVENMLPPLFLPGAKLGLGNAFTLFALFALGPADGLMVAIVRSVAGSLIVGNMSTLVYSLAAGLVATSISAVLVQFVYPSVSVVAVSVCGAVVHNLVQNVVFCVVSDTPEMYGYMPYLALVGVLSGVIVGVAVWSILRTLPRKVYEMS